MFLQVRCLSTVGLKTNTVALCILIPQRGPFCGISLAAVTYWYACEIVYVLAVSGFGSTTSIWIIPHFYFSGHGKAARVKGHKEVRHIQLWVLACLLFNTSQMRLHVTYETMGGYFFCWCWFLFCYYYYFISSTLCSRRSLTPLLITQHNPNLRPWLVMVLSALCACF